jgi:diguanylate cyclase (GGDEF)-like protein/PAS domain S-box-containing protein
VAVDFPPEKRDVNPSDRDRNDLDNGDTREANGPKHVHGPEDDRWLLSVVEHSSEIVTIVDPDGTLRYASPAFGRLLGYDPGKVVGKMNVLEYVHPDDLPHVLEETEKVHSEGGIASNKAEHRFRHKDGSWRWMESVGTYLLDDPSVNGIVVTSRDITNRKESEERLRRAEERYRTLVERVPAVVYVQEIGSPDSAMYMSPRIEALTGYTPEECKDPEMRWRMVHPVDRERMQSEDERTGEPGKVFASEYRVLHRDGRTVWVRNESVLIEDEASGSQYWQGFMLDITERRRVEVALRESEQRFRRSFDGAAIGMALVGTDGRFLRTNRSLRELLGYPEEELLGKTFQDLTHPDDLDVDLDHFGRMLGGEMRTYQVEKRYMHKDGHVVWAILSVSMVHDEEDEPLYFVSQIQDISERKRAEQKIRDAEQRYRTLVEQIPAVTYIDPVNDPDTSLYTSPQIEQMLGYTPQEWQNEKLWPKRLHPEDRERVLAADERFEAGGDESFSEEYRLLAKDGSVVWVREEAVLVRDEAGEPLYWQGVFYDLTERKALEERLQYQAFHDYLTDLPNRRLFMDRLGQALRRTIRRHKRVAVLFMDLDGFKVVNDSLGHDVGDRLLTVVAQRLRRCLRPEDTLARFGGDEFAVLIEALDDPAQAVQVAERIAEELRSPFIMEGRDLYVIASIGISLGDARTHDPDDLLREADTAMYRVKDAGGVFRVFDPAMYERAFTQLEVENDLRRAIEEEEFVVHYQPMVDLQTGELWGMEALVRWDHPERGLLEPSEFVPVAEESGLVIPMGEQILRESCFRAKEWQEEDPRVPPLMMSVNLSASQLSRMDLVNTVERVLGETGLEGSRLTLDVTETVYVKVLAANTAILDRLRALGVRFSIDDFGTGYSSLSYLKRLPADAIKIDKSFVDGLGKDVEDTAVIRMIIELAHTLGLEVIAEGVETEEQVALLKEMGCDFAQGYHFSKPLPPEAASG